MPESIEKIREQFDKAPYPRVPLEESPRERYDVLFTHNLVTAHYLRYQRVLDPKDHLILDAGCGSGYKSLILAEANPGARIVGIDLSEESVKLARKRLEYHGFSNVEFHTLLLEDLPSLGLQFDYINCDEVLYLLPDTLAGLQAMRAVLKPDGILRTNLHSAGQRESFYRAQTFFRQIGLMNQNPREAEIMTAVETMQALKPEVLLKQQAWGPQYEKQPAAESLVLANHLLLGDRGFTIPQIFDLLEAADLEWVSMVNWRHWDVSDLFKDPDNLPALWGLSLMGASPCDRLHLYDLLHPVNRILDFWCTPTGAREVALPVDEWQEEDWQTAIAQLHPQLCHETARMKLVQCLREDKPFEFNAYFDLPTRGIVQVSGAEAACLLPLWDGPQSVSALVTRFQQVCPIDPITLEPCDRAIAVMRVRQLLSRLNVFLYVLLERRT